MRGRAGPPLVVLAAGLARRYGGGCKPLAPIGPRGEAVLDLLVSDALSVGFGRVVLVLNPETGPAIRYHVERCWPADVEVAPVEQRLPLGTVPALLAARQAVGTDAPFAVANGDDVYGEDAMRTLADHLRSDDARSDDADHLLVAYHLRSAVPTDEPVTRGVCEVGPDGYLAGLHERRRLVRHEGGLRFTADDGLEPAKLDGDIPVSVNLWGFRPGAWGVLTAAMAASGVDEEAMVADAARGAAVPKTEVLLPEAVAAAVADGLRVRVSVTDAQLIGVTHAADLPVVTAELARQVAFGDRAARLWERVPD